jgi:2-desacetyl-2-hydroxyethyl bacteriochlorophyllide A dehydrogenase
MRVAILEAPRHVRVDRLRVPEPGAGELLVRVEGCGVSTSNLPVWEGRPWFEYPRPPGSPGHEAWGSVARVGHDVEGFQSGDRVATICDAGYADYLIAPAEMAVRVPDELASSPLPAEPLGCAMNIFRRSAIEIGHAVAIVGVGFLGAMLTRLAAAAGARVFAVSRRASALAMGRAMGAEEAFSLDAPDTAARIIEATEGAGCERVIEATGLQAPLDLASAITRERGRLIIAGYHQDGPRQVDMQSWNWKGLDVVNAHERDPLVYRDGMRLALEAIASGDLDPSPLYTHTYPLEELAHAITAAEERPEGFFKALVTAS